jgi:3-methyladenine DNA glycosylase AlkC
MSKHLDDWARYMDARKEYEAAKDASDACNTVLRKIERQMIDSMLDEDVTGFTHDGLRVSLRQHFGIACNQDNEAQVRDWLTETQGDIELFSKKTLDKSAIITLIKTKLEQGEMDVHEVPDFFKLSRVPIVTVMGWAKRNENES